MKSLSVIVSVYNEQEVLTHFFDSLHTVLLELDSFKAEIIFINDGSTDNSYNILKQIAQQNENIKVIHFSRNFGHEAAMIAGIDHAKGDAIICLDADLQHPPSQIPIMLEKFNEGFQIVSMVRETNADSKLLKRLTSKYFYQFINKISEIKIEPNASDFFLISKKITNLLQTNYRDNNRFLRAYIQNVGFKKTTIKFNAPSRIAGHSKYNLKKLIILTLSAITTTSKLPLRLSVMVGAIFGLFSLVLGIYSIIVRFAGNPFSGYTTIIVFLSFAFSILFFIIGIIGEYLLNIFTEIKGRPIYIIEEIATNETVINNEK